MKKVVGFIGVLLLTGQSVYAEEANLNVQGTVVASGCDIYTGSTNQKIKIGVFSGKDFPSVGSTSSFKAMNINLSNCYNKLTTIMVKFTGTPDEDDPTLLALSNAGSGGKLAAGVGVELLDNSMKTIPFNSDKMYSYEIDGESTMLSFVLRYKSTQYPVTPGDASAVLYFDLSYQ